MWFMVSCSPAFTADSLTCLEAILLLIIMSIFFSSLGTSHDDLVMKPVIRLCVDFVARSQCNTYIVVRKISPVSGRWAILVTVWQILRSRKWEAIIICIHKMCTTILVVKIKIIFQCVKLGIYPWCTTDEYWPLSVIVSFTWYIKCICTL